MEEHDDDHQVCLGLSLGLGSSAYQAQGEDGWRVNKKRASFLDLSISSSDHDEGKHESKKSCLSSCSMVVERDVTRFSRNNCKKRLMLDKDQATLLEETFELNPTLSTAQKQALADQLNLTTRQIEVWFQNRRARSKLKQTELDCKFLHLNCQRLREENLRLEKELLELRGCFSNQVPKMIGSIKTCSSCEKAYTI